MGQAAAGLAHETRNPLGLIRGWTQRLVKAGLPSDEQQEQAEAVLEECDRVTARINQFLAYARQAEADIGPVAIDELVAELQTLLQSDFEAKNLHLQTHRLNQPREIFADREQLRQVLFNLLQNAVAFAPECSTITISLNESRRGAFRLEVADQGPGASNEISDTLFEPYVTRRPGGTGYEPGHEGGSVFWIDGIRSA